MFAADLSSRPATTVSGGCGLVGVKRFEVQHAGRNQFVDERRQPAGWLQLGAAGFRIIEQEQVAHFELASDRD